MASLPPAFNQVFPEAPSGRLHTYDAGTTTPKAAYQDQAGAVAHTLPTAGVPLSGITLDANGRPPGGFFLGSGEYTIHVYTAAGALVKSWDDIGSFETTLADTASATLGAAMVGWLETLAYAANTVGWALRSLAGGNSILRYIPVANWAAIADGSTTTDLTAYYATALAAKNDLYFPSGTFLGQIDLTNKRGKSIRGAGRDVTTLKNYTNAPVIKLSNAASDCRMNHFCDFRIDNRDEATYTAADGIHITGVAGNENDFHTFERIEIVDMRYGINIDNRSVWNSFQDVHAYSCVDGFRCVTTENVSALHFRQCRFGANTGYGMYVSKASGDLFSSWSFDNVTLEHNALNGLRVSGAASGIGGWTFNGVYMENNTASVAASATSPRKANIFIDAVYCVGLVLNSPQLFGTDSGDPLDWCIYMDAACVNASGVISGARWGTTAIGAYSLTVGFSVENDFGTVGSSVAPRGSGNLVLTDFTGSGTAWTPGVQFGGGSTGMTFSNQVGRYVRHGNVIDFTGYVSLSAKGSSTGVVTITGLPVAALNVSNLIQSVTLSLDAVAAGVSDVQGRVQPNGTTIALSQVSAGGTLTALTDASFGASTAVSISGRLIVL